MGNHDEINIAEFKAVNLDDFHLGLKIQNLDEDKSVVVDDTLAITNAEEKIIHSYTKDGETIDEERFDALITVYDWNTREIVYQEKQSLRSNEEGEISIEIGDGAVQQASYQYFDLKNGNYCAEVLTPLNYTNSMLMLSLLGFLGLIFAFFLKREDKVSGYGLEKPNKVN
jgi:hypothetical protein